MLMLELATASFFSAAATCEFLAVLEDRRRFLESFWSSGPCGMMFQILMSFYVTIDTSLMPLSIVTSLSPRTFSSNPSFLCRKGPAAAEVFVSYHHMGSNDA